jgi:DNA-binding MarR family transcriptional regulator
MPASSRAKEAAASTAWRRIFDYIVATAADRVAVLDRLGITAAESRALTSLDPDAGRSMRALADEWRCDPSNATWLVDRLERQGLARRVARVGDRRVKAVVLHWLGLGGGGAGAGPRRVKAVVLTAKGKRIRDDLLASMYTPPRDLLALTQNDLEALSTAASKLPSRRQPT